MLNFKNTFLLAAIIGGLVVVMSTGDAMAQGRRGGRDRGFGGPGAGGRGGGGISGLLRRDDVRSELELTDEQMEDLQTLQSDRGGFEGMRETFRQMQEDGLSREEMRERFTEMRQEREAKIQEDLEGILLPFQFKRLNQISNQAAMRGGARGILEGPIADKLKITDEQKDKMREKAEKLQKELDAKIEKLRKEMQEEILDELTSGQRKEFNELMGDSFKFKQQQRERGPRSGRGGGRGGRPESDDFDV